MDLVLVIDSSSSVIDHFEKYRDLAAQIIDALNVGPYFTRVALVQYASKWRVQIPFHLNTFFTKKQLLDETRNLYYTGGTTNTAAGLTQAVNELSDPSFGARPGQARQVSGAGRDEGSWETTVHLQVVVVFTDGFSQHDPTKPAEDLRKMGVTVYVIAEELPNVEPNFEELWAIAGDKQHVFIQSDLPKVIAQVSTLSRTNCRPLPPGVEPLEREKVEPTNVPFH